MGARNTKRTWKMNGVGRASTASVRLTARKKIIARPAAPPDSPRIHILLVTIDEDERTSPDAEVVAPPPVPSFADLWPARGRKPPGRPGRRP